MLCRAGFVPVDQLQRTNQPLSPSHQTMGTAGPQVLPLEMIMGIVKLVQHLQLWQPLNRQNGQESWHAL